MFDSEAIGQIAVCVCTYRRPLSLSRLLNALAEMERPSRTKFVIVDNDGTDLRTRDLVRDFQNACGVPVTYVVETVPGLSAARNAAFKAARTAGATVVALLDDDEWPSGQWLTKLIDARRSTGAAVIGGPVYPVFEPGKEPPAKYRWLWSVQKGRLRGATHVYCTCNCLVDLAVVPLHDDGPFSNAFGFTGGEDVVFFRQLHAAGIKMAWSDEAIVFEKISGERATFAWLRRRWYRLGNVGVKCERAAPVGEAFAPIPKTILLALRLPIYPLVNAQALKKPWLWLLEAERIRGRLASHAGFVVLQYARDGARQQQCEY
ncbi:MAG TPA: glycosyltransferase [Rhizomicrobium sp.]|jgi:succinoglycan biosynthesis protein ExoM|nr:glycosyltransferase [Rhizomicrobium sp.]